MFTFKLLDVDSHFSPMRAVTSSKITPKGENGARGLFSEPIFGPFRDYRCGCGKYKGVQFQGTVCERCGVTVQSSSSRRFTFGKLQIENGYVLVNPTALNMMMYECISSKDLRQETYAVLTGKQSIDIITGELVSPNESPYTGPMAFREVIYPKLRATILETHGAVEGMRLIEMIEPCLYTTCIPVIPPDLRPIISGIGSTTFMDDLNKSYMIMLMYIKHINDSPLDCHLKLALLQTHYIDLNKKLLKKLSTKSGLMRRYILGKRVDYSGRAVIVPDPTLNIHQVDVPFRIIKEIFKPVLLQRLAEQLELSEIEVLNSYYENSKHDDLLFELSQEISGYPIFLNRQPTLHRPSILAFFVRNVIKDNVLAIPPVITEPFNADFDGDQMAVYFPIGGPAFNESLSLTPLHNISLPSNGEVAFQFVEDLVLGLYTTSVSSDGWNKIFAAVPKEVHPILQRYKDAGKPLVGKTVRSMLNDINDACTNEIVLRTLNSLAKFAHEHAHIAVSITDFATAATGMLDNPVSLMIDGHARGKWDQLKQINDTHGFVSDVEGRVIPTAVKSNLLAGLSEDEFFASAYGGIKGLINTAKSTASSGYLTRRLIYITSRTVLHDSLEDCGTQTLVPIEMHDKKFAYMFLYRLMAFSPHDELFVLTRDNIDSVVGKTCYLRSPITCMAPEGTICHTCYGHLFKKHNSRQIGYIAAQSLGERSTQLTLRTKHTSGATDIVLPAWLEIIDGEMKATIPTIVTKYGDRIVVSDHTETEVVEIPHATLEITAADVVRDVVQDEDYCCDDDELCGLTLAHEVTTLNHPGVIGRISLTAEDVITAVVDFSALLRNIPGRIRALNVSPDISSVLNYILTNYDFSDVHSVHYELLLNMYCRCEDDPHIPYHRNPVGPNIWVKEKDVLDAMAIQSMVFERFNQKLPKAIYAHTIQQTALGDDNNILTQLTQFEFGTKRISHYGEMFGR